MRASHWAIATIAVFASTACAEERNALPKDAVAVLEKAAQLEVYSLDPVTPEKATEGFHGWKVLGQTTVKDEGDRKKLLATLNKGVAENQNEAAKCFQPRHGLRGKHDDKTIDLLICFECKQIAVYVGTVKKGREDHLELRKAELNEEQAKVKFRLIEVELKKTERESLRKLYAAKIVTQTEYDKAVDALVKAEDQLVEARKMLKVREDAINAETEFKELEPHVLVSRSPEPAFDKLLKDAGVKLASKPEK